VGNSYDKKLLACWEDGSRTMHRSTSASSWQMLKQVRIQLGDGRSVLGRWAIISKCGHDDRSGVFARNSTGTWSDVENIRVPTVEKN
jgi:hypothetical protein